MGRKALIMAAMLPMAAMGARAQVSIVSAPLLESLMAETHAEDILYYVQQVEQMVQSVETAYRQYETFLRAEERALANLEGITKVESYEDFMNWYNRQVSLEKAAEKRIAGMKLSIGDEAYDLAEINSIPEAFANQGAKAVDVWKNGLSPQERKRVYVNMGLSPGNYEYIKAWGEKEKAIMDLLLTNADIVNEDNMEAAERNQEIADQALNGDVGEKGVMQAMLEIMLDTNIAIRQANYDAAKARELEAVRTAQAKTPATPSGISDTWGKDPDGFGTRRITLYEGEELDADY